jgi:pyridoxal 5'-phosphate synthase pdxT subunit
MTTGILALQGDFREHEEIIRRLGRPTQQVRLPKHLDTIDRLIIPGGESTTIGKLLVKYSLIDPIRRRAGRDLAVWGTCAGAILMAHQIMDGLPEGQPNLDVMDIVARRNAFGRQRDSFEADLDVPIMGELPVPGVFIRAPGIESVGTGVEVLARLPESMIVAARQGRLLATTFHPELTGDDRFHRYFLEL